MKRFKILKVKLSGEPASKLCEEKIGIALSVIFAEYRFRNEDGTWSKKIYEGLFW